MFFLNYTFVQDEVKEEIRYKKPFKINITFIG